MRVNLKVASTFGCGVAALVMVAGLACRAAVPESAVAGEAPPPPIEPAMHAGSTLIDPRADELMRTMSDRLKRAGAFAITADEVYDDVPEHGPRRQLTNARRVVLRRPDRLAGDASGDAVNRAFYYDGRTVSIYDKEQHVWTSGGVPPTIDEALDAIFERTGTVIPLADFLYADPYARMMAGVQRGAYLGLHDAGGVLCHHLSFEQAEIDWQVWIDAGPEPLPRKLVIAYKTEDEVPQYSVTIRSWDLAARPLDSAFVFTPPAGAQRIDAPAAAGTPGGGPVPSKEAR